jgi:L(+)-tartrate dehydratase beta subunit
MAHYDFEMPIDEAQARRLRVDDTVTLHGTLYGIRDATQIHMFDRGRRSRFDMAGHAVIHTAPNVRKVEKDPANPTGYAPVCIGTTTSDRMERFTRPLMQQYGVRLVIGKGGLREGSLKSFQELGGAYLAIIGGTAALETTWIEAIDRLRAGEVEAHAGDENQPFDDQRPGHRVPQREADLHVAARRERQVGTVRDEVEEPVREHHECQHCRRQPPSCSPEKYRREEYSPYHDHQQAVAPRIVLEVERREARDARCDGDLLHAGEDFYRALLRIWLGEHPVQDDVKQGLLGD